MNSDGYGNDWSGSTHTGCSFTPSYPIVTIGQYGQAPPHKEFRKKEPYTWSAFTRNVLRVVDLSDQPKDVTHHISILDDEGQAYVLNQVGSEVELALSEGKMIFPSFFRIASFPVINSEDNEFVSGLSAFAREEATGAIYKQEDAKLCLLLGSLVSEGDDAYQRSHIRPNYGHQYMQRQLDAAVAVIEDNELTAATLLVHPLDWPIFVDLDLRGVRVYRKSVMVPRRRAYLLTHSEYLGALVTMHGIREVPSDTPEMFRQGLVLDELIAMMIINPEGVVEFQL